LALLRCIAGVKSLDQGCIDVTSNVSWSLGEIKALSKTLSAEENSYYLAGIFGQSGQRASELKCIRQMASMEMSEWLTPIQSLPVLKKLEFQLALSLAFDFDFYVVDPFVLRPLLRAGAYSTYWQSLILKRLRHRGFITLADARLGIDTCCRRGLVLEKGAILKQGSASDCRSLVEAGLAE